MNRWKTNNFLTFALYVHLLTLVLVGIGDLGFDIPILRQVIGFIDLTFIPGLLILSVMRLFTLRRPEKLLYSVGLSLFVNMAIGFLINSLYPHIGIGKPISSWPFLITMTTVLLILGIFSVFKQDNGSLSVEKAYWHKIISPPSLFLTLVPLLSILGTQLVNAHHNNILLLILIPLISAVPLLIIYTKFIHKEFYPLAIFMISVALLFHVSLITNYLTGYDVHGEYYFTNLVRINSIWDATIWGPYNAMLSIVMLGPIYSLICGIELTWVFKIIYPLLYSLVPIGIYLICNRQVNSKTSFLAAFFFISITVFFEAMYFEARQEIAELFLILMLLVGVTKPFEALAQKALFLIFSISLIVSHYSISFIFLFLLIVLWILRFLIPRVARSRLIMNIWGLNRKKMDRTQTVTQAEAKGNRLIAFDFVSSFFVASMAWYMWQSSSSTFSTATLLIKNVFGHVFTGLMNVSYSQGLWYIESQTVSLLHEVTKYLYLFTMALIAVGILQLLIEWRKKMFNEDYALLSFGSAGIVAAAIPVPFIANALDTARLYHIMMIFLAPFCIIGSIAIYNFIVKSRQGGDRLVLKIMSTFLAVFLLFNTGFIYEMAQDHPFSISLSQESIKSHGTDKAKAEFYSIYTTDEEVIGSQWLSENSKDLGGIKVYATFTDQNVGAHALSSYGMIPYDNLKPLENSTKYLENGDYVYLSYLNVVEGIGTELPKTNVRGVELFNIAALQQILVGANKIYSNNGIEILLVP